MRKESINMPVATGKAKWARIFENNRDYGFQEDGQYNMVVQLSPTSAEQLKSEGVLLTYSEEGPEFTFRRNHTFIKEGNKVTLGAPKVVDDDLKPFPSDTIIGNGSEVEVLYNLYTPTKGKGKGKTTAKLEAVRVVKLVEYAGAEGSSSGTGFKPRSKELSDDLPDELVN